MNIHVLFSNEIGKQKLTQNLYLFQKAILNLGTKGLTWSKWNEKGHKNQIFEILMQYDNVNVMIKSRILLNRSGRVSGFYRTLGDSGEK